MFFGLIDAEFQVGFDNTKKCIYQKLPKQRDSDGRPDSTFARNILNNPINSF